MESQSDIGPRTPTRRVVPEPAVIERIGATVMQTELNVDDNVISRLYEYEMHGAGTHRPRIAESTGPGDVVLQRD